MKLAPLTEVLPWFWRRLTCVFKDHELTALVRWSPDATCMHFVCARCGKELGHLDLPSPTNRASPKEKMH